MATGLSEVGYESMDDAAVYDLGNDRLLVQSVDFFTPIVDDPQLFGEIAAVNSLSDIYAMGARPLFALNVAGFPSDDLPLEVLTQILQGAENVAKEAGIPILGGHTVKDKEPKFGWAVTGETTIQRLTRNSSARPGDQLVLTKPLGSGIITTAIKRDLADDDQIALVIQVMRELNRDAATVMAEAGVRAATDITGYGLLGHLLEMCSASKVSARLDMGEIPFLGGVAELAGKGVVPGGTKKNLKYVAPHLQFAETITPDQQLMLADAQTSGGLLMAVPAKRLDLVLDKLLSIETLAAAHIGSLERGETVKIFVEQNQ